MKSNIGPGAAAALIVVVALVIVGLLWKVYFSAPAGATNNPYKGKAPAGMGSGGPPPGMGYQDRSMRPTGPGPGSMPGGPGGSGGPSGTP